MIRGLSKLIEKAVMVDKNQVLGIEVDMKSEVTDSKSGVKL